MKYWCPKGYVNSVGTNTGECCCNCKNRIIIKKHPWNKLSEARGSMNRIFGYGCSAFSDKSDEFVFFDWDHGYCESWRPI